MTRSGTLLRTLGVVQFSRLLTTALGLASDRLRGADVQTSIDRAVRTLGALKGAFAKAGQFAAVRHDVLPAEATTAFASLRDAVPALPFERIRPLVEAELGDNLESLFSEFESQPLGAASIAQVHRARLLDGTPVAVKVQYPWLQSSLPADLWLLRRMFGIWARRAGHRQRGEQVRLFEEFSSGLREELDFLHEAAVGREIRENLSEFAQVLVPQPIESHCSRRILTMTYVPAVRVDDAAGLAQLGVDPARVLEILGRAYAKQIFVDGLFHADPHPGNLFVVDEPDAATHPRLLFVDFGLSSRLDPELRREIRHALYALLQRDLDGFLAIMDRMGMIAPGAQPEVRRAVGSMFKRVGDQPSALSMAGSQMLSLKDEAKALLQETDGLQLPNDLLLFAKTLSYLFALGERISPETDLMRLYTPYLLRFLAEKDPA